jgi:isopenicillin-N N-acyltransferase-like protein
LEQTSTRTFPFVRFSGSHRDIGRQFGEQCRDLIHHHRDLAIARLSQRSRLAP